MRLGVSTEELKERLQAYVTEENDEDFSIDGGLLVGDMCLCAKMHNISLEDLLKQVTSVYNSIEKASIQ